MALLQASDYDAYSVLNGLRCSKFAIDRDQYYFEQYKHTMKRRHKHRIAKEIAQIQDEWYASVPFEQKDIERMRRRTGRYFIEVSNGDEVCRTREDMLDGVVRSVNCDCRCLYFNDYKEGHSKQEVVLVIIEFQKLWDFYINNIAAAEIAEAESSFVMPRVKIYWETYPETADLDKQSRFSREHIVIDGHGVRRLVVTFGIFGQMVEGRDLKSDQLCL